MRVVAVLRGGVGDEHEVSLKTGATVLQNLSEKDRAVDVFIGRDGMWHVRGVPKTPEQALAAVDVVFNALHGQYGEDGEVQRMLDRIGIPYTGSGALSSALAMNKALAKETLERHGVRTANSVRLSVTPDLEDGIVRVFRSFPQPCVVKPLGSGSSVGVSLAKSFDEFKDGVKKAFSHSKEVLVEQFIKGKEATVGIVNRFRDQEYYKLPPVEIIPKPDCVFFDYDAKYSGESEERCPGNFSASEAQELQRLAHLAHEGLGLRHYSRSDFIVAPDSIYFLETNTLPDLTDQSLMLKSLAAVGVGAPEFLDHMLNLAYEK